MTARPENVRASDATVYLCGEYTADELRRLLALVEASPPKSDGAATKQKPVPPPGRDRMEH